MKMTHVVYPTASINLWHSYNLIITFVFMEDFTVVPEAFRNSVLRCNKVGNLINLPARFVRSIKYECSRYVIVRVILQFLIQLYL